MMQCRKNSKTKVFTLLFIFILSSLTALAEDTPPQSQPQKEVSLAAELLIQSGYAMPGGDLTGWVNPAQTYRLKLFGGARIAKISWLGALGLGLDFTFSSHTSRINDPGFRYNRYTWDWLSFSFGIGPLHVNPAISWVVTDVYYGLLDINQTSIRPAGTLTLGLGWRIFSFLSLRIDGRIDYALAEAVRANDGSRVNLNGIVTSAFAGLDFHI